MTTKTRYLALGRRLADEGVAAAASGSDTHPTLTELHPDPGCVLCAGRAVVRHGGVVYVCSCTQRDVTGPGPVTPLAPRKR